MTDLAYRTHDLGGSTGSKSWFKRTLDWIARSRQKTATRATRRLLLDLDDHTLADIGVRREDLLSSYAAPRASRQHNNFMLRERTADKVLKYGLRG